MAEHHWSVLCRESFVDGHTNNIALVVQDTPVFVDAGELPISSDNIRYIRIPFQVVSAWSRTNFEDAETFQVRLRLAVPSGATSETASEAYNVTISDTASTRTFMPIAGVQFLGEGRYRIIVEWRDSLNDAWRTATTLPLDVLRTTQEPTGHHKAAQVASEQ